MKYCKFCGSVCVKHGVYDNKQRYKCKKCSREQMQKDGRQKYSQKIIQTALTLFSEGNNYSRIARILNKVYDTKISYQLIIYWVKKKLLNCHKRPVITRKNKKLRLSKWMNFILCSKKTNQTRI